MKINNSNGKLKLALLFLLVLNMATFGTIIFHQIRSKNEVQSLNNQENSGNHSAFSGYYFREKLNLTPEQMLVFKDLNRLFRSKARNINRELGKTRQQMLITMQQTPADTLRLLELSAYVGNLHKNLKEETFRYYLGIKTLCDSSQQVILNQLFSEFFIHENNPDTRGKGLQQQRFGKRNNN
ncbi:MAG: Spy/CpxP family protein refolding chaperone [Salinivirgaceae bacterium]